MFALNERVKSYGSVDIPAEDYSLEGIYILQRVRLEGLN